MVTTSDLEKWQKAIQGIEAGQNNLSSEELLAFNALKELFNNSNFESNESSILIKTLKDALPKHGNHRLLQKVHLPNFINLCETYFKSEMKTVVPPVFTSPTFVPPTFVPPTSQPPTPPVTPTPTFGDIPSGDIADFQKATVVPPLFIPPTFEPPIIQPPTFQPPVTPEITPPEPVVEKPTFIEPAPPVPPIIAPNIQEEKDNKKTTKSNKQLILIIVAIALLIAGWQVHKNWDTVSNWEPLSKLLGKTKTTVSNGSIAINPLVGKWKGLLNNEPATLEFLSIDIVGNVKGQIYFSENRPDTLRLIGTIDGYLIELKDNTGKYSGVLQQDSSFYYGTFYDKSTGTSSNFSFRNPKIAVDSVTEQTEQVDTILTAQVKGSTVIAPPTKESEKAASVNSSKAYTQPAVQMPEVIEKIYSFGIYIGSTINGYPEGNGKMTYNRQVQIAKQDTKSPPHFAGNGDYFIGSWGNGDIISGTLYDKNGHVKETILAPKRFNLHNISND